jgi:ABC-2 type transport system ATP-binding protein
MSDCIEIEGLAMHFRGCKALDRVNLSIKSGSVCALLGENGAGKTTLIRILTGFQRPTRGSVRVLGLDPVRDALEIRRRIGYVSDSPALYQWMRIDEIGSFASAFYPAGYLDKYHELITHYELPADRKIKHLSKGQRAKVALALAVSNDPELLILDEPTSGLDPLVRRAFLESMVERAARGRTVLLSSHQISEIERVADRMAIIHGGQVRLSGSLSEMRDEVVEVTFSVTDPLAVLPVIDAPVEIFSEQKSGRQVRWIARDGDNSIEQTVGDWQGVHSVRKRPASLEELFIACTRGADSVANNSSLQSSVV